MAAWGQQGRRKESVPSGESRSKGRSFGGKADRCGQHVCRIKETREDMGSKTQGSAEVAADKRSRVRSAGAEPMKK